MTRREQPPDGSATGLIAAFEQVYRAHVREVTAYFARQTADPQTVADLTGDWKQELIIDPATGQFIGERETTARGFGAIKPGTVTSYSALSTGVVAEMGAQPQR